MSKLLGQPPTNVVRVDFRKPATGPWVIKLESPWLWRLGAVLIVLLLSLLMI